MPALFRAVSTSFDRLDNSSPTSDSFCPFLLFRVARSLNIDCCMKGLAAARARFQRTIFWNELLLGAGGSPTVLTGDGEIDGGMYVGLEAHEKQLEKSVCAANG